MGNVLFWIFQQVRRHIMRRPHLHGSKLQNIEIGLMYAHTLLPEYDRTGIIQLDQCRNYQHGNSEQNDTDGCQKKVNNPFPKLAIHISKTSSLRFL